MKISPELYQVKLEETTIWSCKSQEQLDDFIYKLEKLGFVPVNNSIKFEEGTSYYNVVDTDVLVLNKDQIIELSLASIRFKIERKISAEVDISKQLVELAEKPIKVVTEGGAGNTYNNKCEVHMPGHMMGMYNDLLLLEDACTDELQASLNAGWRIIAACPQPDQRRPDYILGRFNPECNHLERGGVAAREAML